MEYDSLHTLV